MEKPGESSRSRSNRWLLLLFLLLLLIIILAGGYFILGGIDLFGQPDRQLLPVSLLSHLTADYNKEPMALAVPPMELSIINEALTEGQTPTGVPERLATVYEWLKTPVPQVTQAGSTPQPTQGAVATVVFTPTQIIKSPTGTSPAPSQTASSSPSVTPTIETVTLAVSFSPTSTINLPPTQKPKPTNTTVPPSRTPTNILPTATQPLPTATSTKPPPTNTPVPSTPIPTATRTPNSYPPPGPTPYP